MNRRKNRRKAPKHDIELRHHGSIVLFVPLSDFARQWVDENVSLEPWQWFGPGFGVDHRYASPLADGMTEAGLLIR